MTVLLASKENTSPSKEKLVKSLPRSTVLYQWSAQTSLRGQSMWWHDFYFQPTGAVDLRTPSHLRVTLPYCLPWFEEACEAFLEHLEASLPEGDTSYSPLLEEAITLSSAFWSSLFGIDYSQEAEDTGHKPLELLFLLLFDHGCYSAYIGELQFYEARKGGFHLLSPEAIPLLLARPFPLLREKSQEEKVTPFVPKRDVPSHLFTFLEEERYLEDLCQNAAGVAYAPLLALLSPEARADFVTVLSLAVEQGTRYSPNTEGEDLAHFLTTLPWHEGLRPSVMSLEEVLALLPQDREDFQWVLTSMKEVRGPTPASFFTLFAYFTKVVERRKEVATRLPKLLVEWLAPEASPKAGAPLEELHKRAAAGDANTVALMLLLEELLPFREELSLQERLLLVRDIVFTTEVVYELFPPSSPSLFKVKEVVHGSWHYTHPLGSFAWALCLPKLLEVLSPAQAVRLVLEWQGEVWEGSWPPLTLALVEEVQAHPEWAYLPFSWWLPFLFQEEKARRNA